MIKLKSLLTNKISKKKVINEAIGSYKSVFDYDAEDPGRAQQSFSVMFNGAEAGYTEGGDSYGWNDNKNWQKAVDEYHKEIFKFVDEYVKVTTKARKMLNKQDKIFKKWRNKDGSKAGD